MAYPRNGRTIRRPVQKSGHRLPLTEDKARPLLGASDDCTEDAVKARAEYEEELARWKKRASLWQAEANGIRKRSERWVEIQIREERQRLLNRMLTIADNLERALAHGSKNDPLRTGVQLTVEDLLAQLAQEGVEPIQALGRTFDPSLHEAIAGDGSGGDTVTKVIRSGYTLDGETLRAAGVVVESPLSNDRANQRRILE